MHKRALRRCKKVIRRSRVPLRVRRAGTNDTHAQSCAAPHRAPQRRTRGRRWPRSHTEPKPEPKRLRLRLLLWLLLLLLLLLRRGTPRRGAISRTWRAESTPHPGRGTDADACVTSHDATVGHDFVVIGRERRRAQHAFGTRRATHG